MTRPYFLYNGFRYLIDTPLLILSFWLADYYSNGAIDSEQDSIVFIFLLISIISWYSAAQVSGLTKDLRSNKFAEEIIYVLVTLILFAIILTSFLFFFRNTIELSNYFLFIYLPTLFTLILSFRYIFRKYLHSIFYSGRLQEQIILIGSTPAAKDFYETINLHTYYGYKCIGFLDDEKQNLMDVPIWARSTT
jgi:putative colanic acid biosynthesis UDP-glucose lipid carrier transferase